MWQGVEVALDGVSDGVGVFEPERRVRPADEAFAEPREIASTSERGVRLRTRTYFKTLYLGNKVIRFTFQEVDRWLTRLD